MGLQLLIQGTTPDNYSAETGTNATTIKYANHGLVNGDMIVNISRRFTYNNDPCSRIVTAVDANTLSFTLPINGQVAGDEIRLFKYQDRTALLKAGSLECSNRLDRRNDCRFKLIVDDADQLPKAGQNIKVMNDNILIFGGAIKNITIKKMGPKLFAECQSEGYGHIPSRRTIDVDYLNKYSKEIIKDIIDKYLVEEGITYDYALFADGYYWEEYPADVPGKCITCQQILDDMAEASSCKWYIDNYKQLHFVVDDTVTDAPHVIDTNFSSILQDCTLEEKLINYRNKQFVKAGADDFGDDIIVSYQNLQGIKDRQDVEGGSGVYGNILEDTEIDNTTTKTAGAGTTTTNIYIGAHGLSDGDIVYNITRNSAKREVAVVDLDNVTVSEVTGQTTGDQIVYYPDANKLARTNIKRYGLTTPRTFTFETLEVDFRAGQKLTVQLPDFGIINAEHFLIEEVTFSDIDGVALKSEVKAISRSEYDISTKHTANWIDEFAKFAKPISKELEQIAVGPNPPNRPKMNKLWIDTSGGN